MRFLNILAVTVMLITGQCSSSVAPTTLAELTHNAGLIVLGRVAKVTDIKGLRVAEVQVAMTLKGTPRKTAYYLAQPTWVCDTATAEVGQETLFFFTKYRFDPHPASVAYVKPTGTAGSYRLEDGATPSGAFKEPVGFREAVTSVAGDSSLWQVSWAGRGGMPLRTVRDVRYVTVWIAEVRRPTGMATINGPERKYSFIRSVPLSQMLVFIQQETAAHAQRRLAQHHH